MIHKIIKFPAPSLRRPTAPVLFPLLSNAAYYEQHFTDMFDTLKAKEDGLALASNQILESGHRVFVVKDLKELNDIFPGGVVINPLWAPVALLNQVITDREGCLSFPGMTFEIPRYDRVIVFFTDIDGQKHEKEVSGLIARMVQHECDHLDGKLFIEMLPKKTQINIRNNVISRKKAGKW